MTPLIFFLIGLFSCLDLPEEKSRKDYNRGSNMVTFSVVLAVIWDALFLLIRFR